MSKIERYIANVEVQLQVQAGLKALCVGIAVGVFSMIFTSSILTVSLVACTGLVAAAFFMKLFHSKRMQALEAMHSRFPELEFSLELLAKSSRNLAEQLQLERVNTSFQGGPIRLWHKNTWPYLLSLLLAMGVYGLSLLSLPNEELLGTRSNSVDKMEAISVGNQKVEMTFLEVAVTPPAYTGLQKNIQSTLDVRAVIGSDIEWTISFSASNDLLVELINSNGDGLKFTNEQDQFLLRDRVRSSGIYAIRASRQDEVIYESDYYPFEAILDLAPVIQPKGKELYTYHFTQDPKIMQVSAKVSDDFKVREVFLVATLARGSGENVKFRENRIPVTSQEFRSEDLAVQLDLNALDFKHGDELYYYWAAIDNKTPEPNFSRSDTYFINYVDSAGMSEEELIGMAIHVMPDYFRSQRQIIIDTQKLLAEKKNLTEREFNVISNEIGYDQKMLRLRYGQYLGEEFEDNAGGGQGGGEGSANLLEGYEHRHDEENEAGITANVLLPTQVQETHQESQSHSTEDDSGLGSILDSYLHNHENAEANTYFEESTKSTLKLALEQMWQSELYLRLFKPVEALPYQEKALEYLKTVQQKSRVYVKRTGFDPPPLKQEEKRLTGDLAELTSQLEKEQLALANRLAPLAAQVLGLLPKQELSATDKAVVQKFGELWTGRMNYSGMQDWSVLLELQELNSGKIDEEGRKLLFQKLYPLISQSEGVNASFLKNQKLEKAFWSQLQ